MVRRGVGWHLTKLEVLTACDLMKVSGGNCVANCPVIIMLHITLTASPDDQQSRLIVLFTTFPIFHVISPLSNGIYICRSNILVAIYVFTGDKLLLRILLPAR